ncbi:MAG: hypothetical protein IH986_17420 [Planctomycetes bacterium]|nr:hypothetical protein [Planctomycetota bacterium]
MRRHTLATAAVLFAFRAAASPAVADEAAILSDIKAFFESGDIDRRESIARRIESDPDYDRAKVGEWLNRADLFQPLEPGTRTLRIPLDTGQSRSVLLRVPKDYDPKKAWPFIYGLHGSHGTGDGIMRYVEAVLGDAVDDFIIAAPTHYKQAVIHSQGEASAEHPIVWHTLKKTAHIDSDRMYVMGYSLGGHSSWTLGILHADRFAAVLPVAGSFFLPYLEQLWPPFLPNLQNTHVLNSWGAGDDLAQDGVSPSPEGGITESNRKLRDMADEFKLNLISFEDPDKGHGGVRPPRELLDQALSRVRQQYPNVIEHTFRYAYQGRAYWVEVHDWRGKYWVGPNLGTLRLREGEDPHAAMRREIRSRLGRIRGRIAGQTIDVRRKHFGVCTVWFGDGMIDWEQPVLLKVSGRKAFEGLLKPDLFVCLMQAVRTYDLQRLRWAGLRFKSGRKTKPITGRTPFPTILGNE